jgi:hypothetical protein
MVPYVEMQAILYHLCPDIDVVVQTPVWPAGGNLRLPNWGVNLA